MARNSLQKKKIGRGGAPAGESKKAGQEECASDSGPSRKHPLWAQKSRTGNARNDGRGGGWWELGR